MSKLNSEGNQAFTEANEAENTVSEMLRDLSGVDEKQARSIVAAWGDWQLSDVLDTIVELRTFAETDRSLEFDTLFRAAIGFPEANVRLESVRALSNGGSVNIAQTLLEALERDEDARVRAAAAESLHAFADPSQARNISGAALSRIAAALSRAASQDESAVSGKALKALAAMRVEEVPDLIDAMFDDAIGDPELMSDVLLAMGESGDTSWLPTIEDAFYSGDAQIRIAAVMAFGEVAGDDDVESLSEPFDDHVLEVQMATVQALANIGSPQAREMLSLAVKSSEPEVQQMAQTALDLLKAEDDLTYAVSPDMVAQGLFGVPLGARRPPRDLSRYDAPTEEGWANVTPEGQEIDVANAPDDIGEDYEDYLESDEFFRDSNTN
ncbi:MAG: hypothetical protein F4X40_02210 [Chloroflexi bacterium]|nr:hypothetical protein [Chloroflexota bacterium]